MSSYQDLPHDILQPPGLLGGERDPRPWEVYCGDHGLQPGRLCDDAHFGEASNRGLCEVCLMTYYVRCSKGHGVQLKTIDDGGCYVCYQESIGNPGAAVAAGSAPPPAAGAITPGDLPGVGVDAGQAVLDVPVRIGPPAFGGLSDGAGGWATAGTVSGGSGSRAGDRAARSEPATARPPEATAAAPILTQFRALAASGLLKSLAAAQTTVEVNPLKEEASDAERGPVTAAADQPDAADRGEEA